MNICILSGSARANNNTIRVGYALQRLLKNEHSVSVIDFQQYDIPLINQGEVSLEPNSDFQKKLFLGMKDAQIARRTRISGTALVIIASGPISLEQSSSR